MKRIAYSLLIPSLICMLASCKKDKQEQNDPCNNWNSLATESCLLHTSDLDILSFSRPGGEHVYESTRYSYDGRRLTAMLRSYNNEQSVTGTSYTYNDCVQLTQSTDTDYDNTTVDGKKYINDYTYDTQGNILRTDHSLQPGPTSKVVKNGYTLYHYSRNLTTIHHFDSSGKLAYSDSIIYRSPGIKAEEWTVYAQGDTKQLTYNNAGTARPQQAHAGDRLSYYINNTLYATEIIDSVYYNSYGYDTLSYGHTVSSGNVLMSFNTRRKSYTGCR